VQYNAPVHEKKLPLFLIKQHSMKIYGGGVEIQLHAINQTWWHSNNAPDPYFGGG
jgi:hypothetical protein